MSLLNSPLAFDIRLLLLWAIPLFYLFAAFNPSGKLKAQWRTARFFAGAALIASALSFAWTLLSQPLVHSGVTLLSLGKFGAISLSIRADFLTIVLLLVSFIGWIIVGYSQTYLAGEARQVRYIRALMATLVAVAMVILTNNLAVLALAWLATSLSLHQLLTYYPNRVAAQIAAHKKFLASRLADVCLFSAVALIGVNLGTLEIDELLVRAAALGTYSFSLQLAAVLLAITALLKCAQIPLHGWLIQVMEAPTPVSALLHAGVINLGGFVMIRLAGLVADVPQAQTLLVVVGALTATIAALVMMTRISIKVMLAWSTCAQMGFMLMQCGLGLYELALLHLLAHSLYKAYAFLSAGGAVETSRIQQMTESKAPAGFSQRLLAVFVGVGIVTIAATVWKIDLQASLVLMTMACILSLALTPLLQFSPKAIGTTQTLIRLGTALSVALIYFALHHLLKLLFDASGLAQTVDVNTFTILFVLIVFISLFIVQSIIRETPQSAFAKRLYPWFYSGLYLDELFTRVTFRIYPIK